MSTKAPARRFVIPARAVWSDTPKSASVEPRQPRLQSLRADPGETGLSLTGLELGLISDVLAGYEDAEIARRALPPGQLEACLAALFEKLGVRDRLELALLLVHHGL